MSYVKSTSARFDPYSSVESSHLSTVANCYSGNQIAGCQPHINMNKMSANVFRGQHGSGVRFIQPAVSGHSASKHAQPHNNVNEGYHGETRPPSSSHCVSYDEFEKLLDKVQENDKRIESLENPDVHDHVVKPADVSSFVM